MSVANDPARILAVVSRPYAPAIARARQDRVELAANHLLDELPHTAADPSLNRIKPVVEKVACRLGQGLRGFKLRGNACHGVVSGPALQRRMIRG